MSEIKTKIIRKEDLGYASYELLENDSVVLRLSDDLMIDLEIAKEMDEALSKITDDIPKKILVLNGKFTSANTEARSFLAGKSKVKQIARCSVTIHSLSQRILANFFLRVNKPPFPVKFFNSEEAAEKWLFKKSI